MYIYEVKSFHKPKQYMLSLAGTKLPDGKVYHVCIIQQLVFVDWNQYKMKIQAIHQN